MRAVKIAVVGAALAAAMGGTTLAQRHPSGGSGSGSASSSSAGSGSMAAPVTTSSGEKPAKMYEGNECLGAMVYVSSHAWRECCLLCAMGDDSPSPGEKAEAEKANEKIVVNNYYDVSSLGRSTGGGKGGGAKDSAAAAPATGGGGGMVRTSGGAKEPGKSTFAHNRMGGLAPLSGLSSSGFGGDDSK